MVISLFFAWKCLESAALPTVNDAFHCDHLAAELTMITPEEGFKFLAKILRASWDSKKWRRTDRYDTSHAFRDVLTQHDRRRTLLVVLQAALGAEDTRYSLTQDLRALTSLERDQDMLVKFASESEQHAELIAAGMTSTQRGFWPLAFRLIEKHQNSRSLLQHLSFGAEQMGEVHTGPGSSQAASCLAEVEAILANPSTPAAARPWLEELRRGLATRAQEMLRFEITAEVNDWRHRTPDGSVTPERLWAIQKMIRDGRLDVLAELIRKDEMLSLLPQLNLSAGEIRAARNKIRTS
jgi:hypothetical protein